MLEFGVAFVYLLGATRQYGYEIAEKVGKKPSYISDIKNGKKRGSEKVRREIARCFGLEYEEMLSLGRWIADGNLPEKWPSPLNPAATTSYAGTMHFGRGSIGVRADGTSGQPPPKELPDPSDELGNEYILVPKYQAQLSGGHGSFETSDQVVNRVAFRRQFLETLGNPKKMAMFEVSGESMSPVIWDGDTVLVDLSQDNTCAIIDGKMYAFREGDMVKVKMLSMQGDRLLATSHNTQFFPPYYPDVSSFSIIGRVLWRAGEVR